MPEGVGFFFLFNFSSLGGSILKIFLFTDLFGCAKSVVEAQQGLPFSLWDMWDLVLGLESNLGSCMGARSLSHWTTSTDLLVFKDGFL